MFLKDHLKDTYQKASLDKNNFVLENIINRWAHRFGVASLHELIVKNQDQINLIEEDEGEENQDQINLIEEDEGEENQDQINLIEEDEGEENQDQINLIEEDEGEENQDQIDFSLLENFQYQGGENFKTKESKKYPNSQNINKDIYKHDKNKSEYIDTGKLPLPNINTLRKWINNDKKAS